MTAYIEKLSIEDGTGTEIATIEVFDEASYTLKINAIVDPDDLRRIADILEAMENDSTYDIKETT